MALDEVGQLRLQLSQIQDSLSMAMQADLEHGVKWLNEAAAAEFANQYPNICHVIRNIQEMEE